MSRARRVVTGHTSDDKAMVASDTSVDGVRVEMLAGSEWHLLWGMDCAPTFPDSGALNASNTFFPPLGGVRFMLVTIGPESGARPAYLDEAAIQEIRDKLPGLMEAMDPNNPGMHKTASIDFEYIISGDVWLELDDGREVHLKAGDTVVQNGTRHAWRNKSNGPCQFVAVLVGTPHRGIPGGVG